MYSHSTYRFLMYINVQYMSCQSCCTWIRSQMMSMDSEAFASFSPMWVHQSDGIVITIFYNIYIYLYNIHTL